MVNETLFPTYNGTTIVDMVKYGNTITNNLFGASLLILIWMVLFFAQKGETTENIAVATFITTVISWLFASIGIVGSNVAISFTVALVGSVILMWRGD